MKNLQIRQEIVQSLNLLSDAQLIQIRELIRQSVQPTQPHLLSQEKRKSLICALQGKYAHAPTSSEDFAQQKQNEIEWEERHK